MPESEETFTVVLDFIPPDKQDDRTKPGAPLELCGLTQEQVEKIIHTHPNTIPPSNTPELGEDGHIQGSTLDKNGRRMGLPIEAGHAPFDIPIQVGDKTYWSAGSRLLIDPEANRLYKLSHRTPE